MSDTIYFRTPKGDDMVILPKADYDRLQSLAALCEDAIDVSEAREILGRINSGEEEILPADVVKQLIDGENPLKVYRKFRGLTMAELAIKASLSQSYISHIEHGDRNGSTRALAAIADVLGVTIEDLL